MGAVHVLRSLDLSRIAADIDTPYRPEPVVSLGGIEVEMYICEGQRGWSHRAAADEALFVLEGVMNIVAADGAIVYADEGDVVQVPAGINLTYKSGMRTSVAMVREGDVLASTNGHEAAPAASRSALSTTNVGVDVLSADPFSWLSAGAVGAYAVSATRLQGTSAPYVGPPGSLLMIVYRGVLDYVSEGISSTVVGGEALVIPSDVRLEMSSKRGATVLAVGHRGASLPAPAVTGAKGAGRGGPR